MTTPQHIYTLGDYYRTPLLRMDCHSIKDGNMVAACDSAYRLAKKLPKDCILVAIPSLSGHNEDFARKLAYYANVPVSFCLQRGRGYGSLYEIKKQRGNVTEEMTGIWCNGKGPDGHIVLVDNVIATGTTMSAAIKAIGKPCDAAVVAVDYKTYEQYGN